MLDIISDKCAADNMADNKNIRRPPCGFGLKSRGVWSWEFGTVRSVLLSGLFD